MEENKEEKREKEQDLLQTLTLALFDLLWFRRLILLHHPPLPLPPATPPPPPPEVEDAESSTASPPPPANILRRRSLHRRSLSDDLPPSPPSSTLQIRTPKLQTILSGKETAISDEIPRFEADGRVRRRRRRERRRRSESSKSMSELEFEELKGFMDLGFTFSDVGADPRLMEIVPGLQRLKAADDEASSSSCASADDDTAVPRPYLSEAWDAAEEEGINRLRNFKIPIGDGGGGGIDLKDQLRFWAHAVASTVR